MAEEPIIARVNDLRHDFFRGTFWSRARLRAMALLRRVLDEWERYVNRGFLRRVLDKWERYVNRFSGPENCFWATRSTDHGPGSVASASIPT